MMRWLVMIVFALSSATAIAQPSPDRAAQRRERIKERIRALRAYTLTAELQLDEQTAAKLFPALKKFDDEFDKLLEQRMDIQRRLEAAGGNRDAAVFIAANRLDLNSHRLTPANGSSFNNAHFKVAGFNDTDDHSAGFHNAHLKIANGTNADAAAGLVAAAHVQ